MTLARGMVALLQMLCATAGVGVGVLVAAPAVLAQETLPWAKYVELTERKGFKDGREADACVALGLPQTCAVFQAPYNDKDGYAHVFNVFRDPETRALHIILFKDWESRFGRRLREGTYYLTGVDGQLRAAAVASPEQDGKRSWTQVPVGSPKAQKGFAEEVAFWRGKQADLENEPDRKD